MEKERRVGDKAYGGGTGMVMQAQPVYDCIMSIISELGENAQPRLIYMSPQGRTLNQEIVKELAAEENLIILCGHYEGIDQRVLDELNFEEISTGDYVVTGGELPALIVCDAAARMCDGVLASSECFEEESHFNGLLEYPQYSRPAVWHGRAVPEILLSGNHEKVRQWRRKQSLRRTRARRPDMYEKLDLSSKQDKKLLMEMEAEDLQAE